MSNLLAAARRLGLVLIALAGGRHRLVSALRPADAFLDGDMGGS